MYEYSAATTGASNHIHNSQWAPYPNLHYPNQGNQSLQTHINAYQHTLVYPQYHPNPPQTTFFAQNSRRFWSLSNPNAMHKWNQNVNQEIEQYPREAQAVQNSAQNTFGGLYEGCKNWGPQNQQPSSYAHVQGTTNEHCSWATQLTRVRTHAVSSSVAHCNLKTVGNIPPTIYPTEESFSGASFTENGRSTPLSRSVVKDKYGKLNNRRQRTHPDYNVNKIYRVKKMKTVSSTAPSSVLESHVLIEQKDVPEVDPICEEPVCKQNQSMIMSKKSECSLLARPMSTLRVSRIDEDTVNVVSKLQATKPNARNGQKTRDGNDQIVAAIRKYTYDRTAIRLLSKFTKKYKRDVSRSLRRIRSYPEHMKGMLCKIDLELQNLHYSSSVCMDARLYLARELFGLRTAQPINDLLNRLHTHKLKSVPLTKTNPPRSHTRGVL